MNAIKVWVNNTKALSAIESFMVDNAFVLLDKKKVQKTNPVIEELIFSPESEKVKIDKIMNKLEKLIVNEKLSIIGLFDIEI